METAAPFNARAIFGDASVRYIAPARAASAYRAVAAVSRDNVGALSPHLRCDASAGVTPMSDRRSASSARSCCNCQYRERGEIEAEFPDHVEHPCLVANHGHSLRLDIS
ncbi:hypothetical protein [Ensifer canadensis]